MKAETLKQITKAMRADGYQLDQMRFVKGRKEVTIWLDGEDDTEEIKNKIRELREKITKANDSGCIEAAGKLTDELNKLLEKLQIEEALETVV